jgi:hypothetical protein
MCLRSRYLEILLYSCLFRGRCLATDLHATIYKDRIAKVSFLRTDCSSVVPCTLKGVISFNEGAKLCPFYCTSSISFIKNRIHRLIAVWLAGRRGDRTAADILHSLSVDHTAFVKNCLRIGWTTHGQVSLSLVGTCRRQGFWASSILMCCENVEFWKIGCRSRSGHSDSSSCSGRSHRKISRVGRSCDGAIVPHFYHLQHEWVTCLCSGHWLLVRVWILVQWELGYRKLVWDM